IVDFPTGSANTEKIVPRTLIVPVGDLIRKSDFVASDLFTCAATSPILSRISVRTTPPSVKKEPILSWVVLRTVTVELSAKAIVTEPSGSQVISSPALRTVSFSSGNHSSAGDPPLWNCTSGWTLITCTSLSELLFPKQSPPVHLPVNGPET